jgi:hypothetical protein
VIGKLFALGADTPYVHPSVFMREETSGPERLRIGGGPDSVAVLLDLARFLAAPLFVLVVLAVPRRGVVGRYESDVMSYSQVAAFLGEFGQLFREDARSSVWIGATDGSGLIALDEHDLLYGYGPLDEFTEQLAERGYVEGVAAAPDPHEHRFNAELDDLEVKLCSWPTWRRVLPLQEADWR